MTTNKYQFVIWTTGLQYLVSSLKDPSVRKNKKKPTPEDVDKFYNDEEEIFANDKSLQSSLDNNINGILGFNFGEKLGNLGINNINLGFAGNSIASLLGFNDKKGNADFLKIGDSYSWGEGYKGFNFLFIYF